ncbi:hypothetical protein [Myceligenerans indicum]|uniref:Uncharacterized protein n=1 Tax=Myceligenerans indicum TaxID=2593663 RepID=A0ABS1LR90_9MICO|nr:hypothetical protein [Myceligenerans indicum]MBL0888817.1 hypothetical protein [Myceligenerans indicum]
MSHRTQIASEGAHYELLAFIDHLRGVEEVRDASPEFGDGPWFTDVA